MITNFKIFEEVKERSSNDRSTIQDNDYVILDHHYFHYKLHGDIIIGKIISKNKNTYLSKFIKFDDESYNGYYSVDKILYWSESKEDILAYLSAKKFNI